jgi:methylisocitrate lyase
VLYPLSAFRAMSLAADLVYHTIRKHGSQQSVVEQMQTRDDLYRVLDYHSYEQKIDSILKKANA